MMPGGDQSGQKVGIVGSQQRHVQMFDSIRFDLVRIVSFVLSSESPGLGVAGVAWSTSIEAHVNVTGSKPGKRQG